MLVAVASELSTDAQTLMNATIGYLILSFYAIDSTRS